jgi:hypothetical protein
MIRRRGYGEDARRRARRFVFASGDVDSRESHGFLLESRRPVLPKPFELADLGRIIEEICTAAQAA